MSKGLYYFLDSSANAHSKYTGFISWEDLGILKGLERRMRLEEIYESRQ